MKFDLRTLPFPRKKYCNHSLDFAYSTKCLETEQIEVFCCKVKFICQTVDASWKERRSALFKKSYTAQL